MSTEKELRDALRGCLAYLWPAPEEGHTGFVDRLGMEFYRDTGIWPHFKSAPMEVARDTDYAEAQKRWSTWLEAKRNAAAAAAARALEPETREAGVFVSAESAQAVIDRAREEGRRAGVEAATQKALGLLYFLLPNDVLNRLGDELRSLSTPPPANTENDR